MYLRSGALAVALLLGGCAGGPPKPGPESLDLKETPSRPEATSTASDPRCAGRDSPRSTRFSSGTQSSNSK